MLTFTDVATTLDILLGEDVMFGTVGANTPGVVFLDPKGVNSNYVGVSAQVGTMTILAANNSSVQLSWPSNIAMEDESAHTLNFVPKLYGSATNIQSGSTELVPTGGKVTLAMNAQGNYYVWVGGSIGGSGTTPASLFAQAVGAYMGNLTFSVVYN